MTGSAGAIVIPTGATGGCSRTAGATSACLRGDTRCRRCDGGRRCGRAATPADRPGGRRGASCRRMLRIVGIRHRRLRLNRLDDRRRARVFRRPVAFLPPAEGTLSYQLRAVIPGVRPVPRPAVRACISAIHPAGGPLEQKGSTACTAGRSPPPGPAGWPSGRQNPMCLAIALANRGRMVGDAATTRGWRPGTGIAGRGHGCLSCPSRGLLHRTPLRTRIAGAGREWLPNLSVFSTLLEKLLQD